MTRPRNVIAAVLAAVTLLFGAAFGAIAASASGPPVTAPSSGPGPYYSGPLHVCVATDSVAYFELHSTALGNCAGGYKQAALNELTPAFTLQLGTVVYACTAATAQARTAIVCATSSPSSTPSPTSTSTASASPSPTSG